MKIIPVHRNYNTPSITFGSTASVPINNEINDIFEKTQDEDSFQRYLKKSLEKFDKNDINFFIKHYNDENIDETKSEKTIEKLLILTKKTDLSNAVNIYNILSDDKNVIDNDTFKKISEIIDKLPKNNKNENQTDYKDLTGLIIELHSNKSFLQSTEYYNKILKFLDAGFNAQQIKKLLMLHITSNRGDADLIIRLRDEALKHPDMFKTQNTEPDINEINEFIVNKSIALNNVSNFLGEKTLIYTFGMKRHHFLKFMSQIENYINKYYDNEKFIEITNPEKSQKYKSLKQELNEGKNILYTKIASPKFFEVYSCNTEKISDLKNKISELKLNATPENKAEIKQLNAEINRLKAEIQAEKSPEFLKKEKELTEIKSKMNKMIDGRIKDPQNVIRAFHLYKAFVTSDYINNSEINELFKYINPKTLEQEKELNNFIENKLYKILNITCNDETSKHLELSKNKYLPQLFSANKACINGLSKILLLINENKDKSVKDIFNILPQNKETREMFEKHGINYDKWNDVDKNSFVMIKTESLNIRQARENVLKNLENDLSFFVYCPIIFSDHYPLPKEKIDKIKKKLADDGFEFIQSTAIMRGNLYKNNRSITFKDAKKILKIINNILSENNFDTEVKDSFHEMAYEHFLYLRPNEIFEIELQNREALVDIRVQKTDMNNIQHSLFLGNQAACCTAVGSGTNQFSAPNYIMNKFVSAIEINDGDDYAGNSMCYIAEIDGEPSLLIDNIELLPQYQYSDKIRDGVFEYAKKLTKEIGKPDMPIYAGAVRQKCNMKNYDFSMHTIQIIGSSGEDKIYLDFISDSGCVNSEIAYGVNLYKIK